MPLIQIRNPLQTLDLNIPEEGETFRFAGDETRIHKRIGQNIQTYEVRQGDPSFGQVKTYNPGDVQTAFTQLFGTDIAKGQRVSDITPFLAPQPAKTEQTTTITPKPGEFTVEGRQVTPQTFQKPQTTPPVSYTHLTLPTTPYV